MDSSPQVLDSVAETWGYFLPHGCESVSLAGAVVFAAFLSFGPMWSQFWIILIWPQLEKKERKKQYQKKKSQNPQIKFVRRVGTTKSSFLPQQPAWPQLRDPGAIPATATNSQRRAMNAASQLFGEIAGFILSGCLEKLFPELNSTPSFNLRTPPWVNIITFQVWALHWKRSVHVGMIFSTGHSLKCHQKISERVFMFQLCHQPEGEDTSVRLFQAWICDVHQNVCAMSRNDGPAPFLA